MTALNKITGAAQHSRAPQRSEGAAASKALNQSGAVHASPFLAEPSNLTGEAGAPSTLPNYSDQWRNPPDCRTCGRGFYGCVCEWAEPEQEHFKPGLNRDPEGWWRVEL